MKALSGPEERALGWLVARERAATDSTLKREGYRVVTFVSLAKRGLVQSSIAAGARPQRVWSATEAGSSIAVAAPAPVDAEMLF